MKISKSKVQFKESTAKFSTAGIFFLFFAVLYIASYHMQHLKISQQLASKLGGFDIIGLAALFLLAISIMFLIRILPFFYYIDINSSGLKSKKIFKGKFIPWPEISTIEVRANGGKYYGRRIEIIGKKGSYVSFINPDGMSLTEFNDCLNELHNQCVKNKINNTKDVTNIIIQFKAQNKKQINTIINQYLSSLFKNSKTTLEQLAYKNNIVFKKHAIAWLNYLALLLFFVSTCFTLIRAQDFLWYFNAHHFLPRMGFYTVLTLICFSFSIFFLFTSFSTKIISFYNKSEKTLDRGISFFGKIFFMKKATENITRIEILQVENIRSTLYKLVLSNDKDEYCYSRYWTAFLANKTAKTLSMEFGLPFINPYKSHLNYLQDIANTTIFLSLLIIPTYFNVKFLAEILHILQINF